MMVGEMLISNSRNKLYKYSMCKKSKEYVQCDDKLYYIRTDKLNNSINEDLMRYVQN